MSVCVEHGAKQKGVGLYPTSSHLPSGYLLGHNPAERLRMGNASVCADVKHAKNGWK